jgi:peptidoglycan hydrolase-like protein with peptidoglycan-binding domain
VIEYFMGSNIVKLNENEVIDLVKRVVQEQLKQGNINPKNLKLGDGGSKNPRQVADVKTLQQKLMDLSLLVTGSGKPTGYFGPMTDSALKRYNASSKPTTQGSTNNSKPSTLNKLAGSTNLGNKNSSTVKGTNPWDINSYPPCVQKFGKPQSSLLNLVTLFNSMRFSDYQIHGTGFYEGYFFTNDGKYFSIANKKRGTYRCSSDGKLMLDIADKANNPETLKSGKYKFSPRIDAELEHIKNKGMDDAPFFIYDPKDNLIYLFDVGGKYVSNSSVVDGGDAQKELASHKAFSHEDWCNINGLEASPHFCTNKKTKERQDPYMGPIKNLASRFLPKGIYTIKGLAYKKGYVGKSKNVFALTPIKLEGTITAAMKKGMGVAIHGIPNIPERLTANAELEKRLQSDLNSGKVPAEYINDIKAILAANQSFGCIGIPASFVDSKQVQALIRKPGFRVFAMGEGADLLVKNTGDTDDQPLVAESSIKRSVVNALEAFKAKL